MKIEDVQLLNDRLQRVVQEFNSIGAEALSQKLMLTTQTITEEQIGNGGSRVILTANLYVRPNQID